MRDAVIRHLLLQLALALCVSPAWSTPQTPDKFDLDGVKLYWRAGPLEYARRGDPELWARLELLLPQATCTALWRAHIASWEIKEGELRLLSLKASDCSREEDVPLSVVFPNQEAPIFAYWFTGTLNLTFDSSWKCDVFLPKCPGLKLMFERGKMVGKPESLN